MDPNPQWRHAPMYQPVPPSPTGPPGPVAAVAVMLYVLAGCTVIAAALMGVGGAVVNRGSDLPLVGEQAGDLALIGFGGAALLMLLAAADIVLGVYLWKGRTWAKRGVIAVGALIVLLTLASGAAPIAVLSVLVAMLFTILLLAPRTAKTYFRYQRVPVTAGPVR